MKKQFNFEFYTTLLEKNIGVLFWYKSLYHLNKKRR